MISKRSRCRKDLVSRGPVPPSVRNNLNKNTLRRPLIEKKVRDIYVFKSFEQSEHPHSPVGLIYVSRKLIKLCKSNCAKSFGHSTM